MRAASPEAESASTFAFASTSDAPSSRKFITTHAAPFEPIPSIVDVSVATFLIPLKLPYLVCFVMHNVCVECRQSAAAFHVASVQMLLPFRL